VLTWEQIAERKAKGVRFLRNVVQDDDRADDLEDESLEDYAERKRFAVANPLAQGKENEDTMPLTKIKNGTGNGVRNSSRPAAATSNQTTLSNPGVTKSDLLDRIHKLENENASLQDQLDDIADLASAPDGDVEETEDQLVDKLNKVLDIAAPDAVDDDDDSDAEDDDQD
jgi:hypothetical protein